MNVIDKGEVFKLNQTQNRMKAMQLILQHLQARHTWDKGIAVRKLYEEEIYEQKKDCKDFIKNIVRAENTEVVSAGQREICLAKRKKKVKNR